MILVRSHEVVISTTPTEVSATELAKGLSDILNRVRYRGERFIVLRNGEAVATIGPPGPTEAPTLAELADRLRDVPVPHDGFGDVLAEVKANQPAVKIASWPS